MTTTGSALHAAATAVAPARRSLRAHRVASSQRAFVLRHTRLRPLPGLEGIRLHLADEVLPLWHAVQLETGRPGRGRAVLGVRLGRRARDRPLPARPPGGRGRAPGVRPGLGVGAVRDRGDGRRRLGRQRRGHRPSGGRGHRAERAGESRAGRGPGSRRARRRAAGRRRRAGRRLLVRGRARRTGPALAGGGPGRGDRRPGRRSGSALPADRGPRGARRLPGPDDDRARGPRTQGGPRLRPPGTGRGRRARADPRRRTAQPAMPGARASRSSSQPAR